MINHLTINNFKSVKHLETDCKRINIFIGKPNVGKSNILEALSLYSVPYQETQENSFDGLVRFKTLKNLFYDNNTNNTIEISTNIGSVSFQSQANHIYELLVGGEKKLLEKYKLKGTIGERSSYIAQQNNRYKENTGENIMHYSAFSQKGANLLKDNFDNQFFSPIRKYTFNKNKILNKSFNKYLLPPFGENLASILQKNSKLFNEIASFFDDYNLEILFDIEKNYFEIQKKVNKVIYKYPFELIADTLQRIIFYLTVSETNKNISIILEEPETHSYPPYTKMLAERISQDKDNQYFITTHSPYLLNNIIENTSFDDFNIFISYFENFQTKIKKLSKSDITSILDDYTDIFFNLEKFLENE